MALENMNQALGTAVVNLVAVIAAIWLGEHAGGPRGLLLGVIAAVVLALVSAALAWRSSRRTAIALAVTSLLLFSIPWLAAARESTLAFNECLTDGERVREALRHYRDEHQHFPARLSELSLELPGQLVFPPHLLEYERTEAGYELSFSDWLVTHEATDQHGFRGHQ